MKTGALAILVVTMVVSLAYLQGKKADSSSVSEPQPLSAVQAPPSQGGPVRVFPSKLGFVTRENEPVLVLVGVDCGSSQSNPRFELLPPTPKFVTLSLTSCTPDEGHFANTLVAIAPGPGDAGKYLIKIGATSCGAPESEISNAFLTLTLKVKKSN
jgi:hypothetical protein